MVDPETLQRLLGAHGRVLLLYARQWGDAAEDVVQEAFLKLMEQPALPREPKAWLFQVVRNEAASRLRAEIRRRRREEAAADDRPNWFEPGFDAGLDASAATAALQGLPEREREVVVARLWGELTFEQIGAMTGLSASTAHRSYEQGLDRLRQALGVVPNA